MNNIEHIKILEICTEEYFQLNNILVKMVLNGFIVNEEREELLHKSKLIKLKDETWKSLNGAILYLKSHETIK